MEDKQHGKVAYFDSQGNKCVGEYIDGELVLYNNGQQANTNNLDPDNPFASSKILSQLRESKNE